MGRIVIFVPYLFRRVAECLTLMCSHKRNIMVPAYTHPRQDGPSRILREALRTAGHNAKGAAGTRYVDKTPAHRGDALRGTLPAVPSESVLIGSEE